MTAHLPRLGFAAILIAASALVAAPFVAAQPRAGDLRAQAEQGDAAAQSALAARAKAGDAAAQYALGGMYADPDGPLTGDTAEATRLFLLAAEQDHVEAQLSLAVFYLVGEGVPKSNVEAERWFRRAAEQGNAWGQHHLGIMYQGMPGMYSADDDPPIDHAESVRWFERSAAQGNVSAATNLAVKYRHGNGIPQDLAQAFRWYLRAADLGDVAAMGEVGGMYSAGRGTPQDDIAAYMWLDLATLQAGGEDREFLLIDREAVADRLSAQQFAEAERRAAEWSPATATR